MMLVQSMGVSFLWGVVPIILKRLFILEYDYKFIFIISTILMAVLVMPLLLLYKKDVRYGLLKLDANAIWLLVIVGAIDILATWFYCRLLENHDSNIICALTFTSPIFTLLLAYFILYEKVTFMSGLGVILIVAGVVLISIEQ